MSGTKTLVWAVVLVALAAFYYFYDMQGGQRRQEAARQRERLVPLHPDDEVTGMTIQRATDTIRAEKRQGRWYLTDPIQVRGDDNKYRDLARYLAELRHMRLVQETASDLGAFGLAPASLEIHLRHGKPLTSTIVRLGAQNPIGNGYYAQVEGDLAVYLVRAAAKDVLNVTLHDLRDKTVLVFNLDEVKQLHLTHDTAPTMVLQRQDEAPWRLTAPVSAAADTEGVRAFLQRLRAVEIKTFVAETLVDLQPYGLASPALRLTIHLGSDQPPQTLLFGQVDAEQQGVYAMRNGAAPVFLLPRTFWEEMPKTATALRDKTLLRFERDAVTRLELHAPDRRIVVAKTGVRQYRLEQPVDAAGDHDSIYSLLWELNDLKAIDIASETTAEPETYGLAPPRLRVSLQEEASAAMQTLRFGTAAPAGQGTYVQVTGRPVLYLVESAKAQRIINTTALALRDRTLLSFEPQAVRKIHLQYPTSSLSIERHGKGWWLSEPTRQALTQSWIVDNLLTDLGALKYERMVTDGAAISSEAAIETPQVKISLWQQDGTLLGPLVIGSPTTPAVSGTDGVYAQVSPAPPVYIIKADFLRNFPQTPAALTSKR